MAAQRIWLLNFDADDELARPTGYTPSPAALARFGPLVERSALPFAGDRVLAEVPGPSAAGAGFEGRAFCPTPRARRALERAGAALPPSPSLEVLRRVNHRAFSAALGQTLDGGCFVRTREELEAALAAGPGPWILKRPFGFAGRGRQRLRSNELDASVEPFVRASLAGEGLQAEPWVTRSLDVALHGFVTADGALRLGDPTLQTIDDAGAWSASAPLPAGGLDRAEERALFEEAERAGRALRCARYFGPFGVDGFRYRDASGAARFNPRCEINARYSMGFAVGFRRGRPDGSP